jgi:hypothetical protein
MWVLQIVRHFHEHLKQCVLLWGGHSGTVILWKYQVFVKQISKTGQFLTLQMVSFENSSVWKFVISVVFFFFVRLLALRPLLAYCTSLGW